MSLLTLMLFGCRVGGKSRVGSMGSGKGDVNGYSSGDV
jgi:hypothetical protein